MNEYIKEEDLVNWTPSKFRASALSDTIQKTRKMSLRLGQKFLQIIYLIKIHLSYNPAISLLTVYSREMEIYPYKSLGVMFTAVFSRIALFK